MFDKYLQGFVVDVVLLLAFIKKKGLCLFRIDSHVDTI